jgi:hypothetical protein
MEGAADEAPAPAEISRRHRELVRQIVEHESYEAFEGSWTRTK